MSIHEKQRCVSLAFPPVLGSPRDQASVSDSRDTDQKLEDREERAGWVGGQEYVWLHMNGDVIFSVSAAYMVINAHNVINC